jgi:hypothetical protein
VVEPTRSVTEFIPPVRRPESYPIRAKLSDPTAFDETLKLYQSLQASAGSSGRLAPDDPRLNQAVNYHISSLVYFARSLEHPDNWPLCWYCEGRCTLGFESCPYCDGQGFWVAHIPYSARRKGKRASKRLHLA